MYSPFKSAFRAINADDLLVLRTVSEGWFVEYKERLLPPKDIAKSVSAFANHQGGWLFIGVQQTRDGSRCAAAFPGIDARDVDSSLNAVRDAIRAHTSPVPNFQIRAVPGVATEGSIAAATAIIMVRVPPGANPPYVHSSGRIYRRVDDRSDPVAEADRSVIDLLVRRSNQARRELRSFLRHQPSLSKGESENSFLRLFFLQDLLGDRGDRAALNFQGFAELARPSKPSGFSFTWDNVFTMAGGFVARHVATNKFERRVLTWEFHNNGASVFTLPLQVQAGSSPPRSGAKYAGEFESRVGEYSRDRIVGASYLLVALSALYGTHLAAIRRARIRGPVFAKAHLVNVWRRVPFLDTEAFATHIREHGLPICQDDDVFAPLGSDPESFLRLRREKNDRELAVGQIGAIIPLLMYVLEALGIPREVMAGSAKELYAAAERTGLISRPGTTGES